MSALGQHAGVVVPARRSVRDRLASAAKRLLLATLAGLVLAGIVHIVAVLIMPSLAVRDAATAYRALGTQGRAELIARPADGTPLPGVREADPYVVTAICSYDLSVGPLRVQARTGTLPLGLTVHRQGGGVLYAITDRAAIRGAVEFVVMSEAQQDERLAAEDDENPSHELRVVSDTPGGLVVVRVLAKRPTDRPDAEALATGVACGLAD